MEKIYLVVTNSDLTEGRGYPVTIAYCEKESTAKRLSRKRGVMGSDAQVKELKTTDVNGVKMIPVSVLEISRPTKEDIEVQERQDRLDAAIEKARSLGMSDNDIKILLNSMSQ